MSEPGVSFEKYTGSINNESWTSKNFVITDKNPLKVGGCDGPKFTLTLEKAGKNTELNFVSKKYDSEEDARETVKKFDYLRKHGYPVPPTTRYFEKDGNHYVLITDLSKLDGGSLVWGINGDAIDEEYKTVAKINPTEQELESVVMPLATRLDQDDAYAFKDVYVFIRPIDKVNGDKLGVYLLDVNGLTFGKKPHTDSSRNQAKNLLWIVMSDVKKGKQMLGI